MSKNDFAPQAEAADTAAPVREAEAAGQGAAATAKPASPAKKKGPISRARTIVLLVVFLSIVAGLIVGNGWGTLSSLGVGAIAYLCPLGALETLLAGHSPVLRAIISLVCVLVIVALIGRAFCAWVCPVPPLRHFFRPNADKKAKVKAAKADDAPGGQNAADAPVLAEADKADAPAPLSSDEKAALSAECGHGAGHSCSSCASCGLPPVGGKRDGLQIDSRHGVLAGALLSSAIFGFPVFCLICPVGLTLAVVVGIYRAIFQQDPTVSLLIFAVILLVEVVFFRKWCHKFCPIGALMGLVGAKAPFLRPRVAADKCLREQGIDCQACVKACPEQLDPHTASIPECTKCGQCAEACPVGAISFRKRAGAGVPVTADAKGQAKRPGAGCPQPAMAEERDFEEELISELP